ncbi:MAG: hypothetical protein C0501_07780 [Isosphaera sp.]|nr:hypothetical protein [Isosphaera sp.]
MATNRSRRPRDEDDEDEDDRPRRRRRDEDGEDEGERPRGRRRDDEDEDRPRRRRRDEDEEDDRPRRRPKRKSRGGPSTGLILGLVFGGLAVVGVIVAVVLLVGRLGGANISYAKFKAIGAGATIESLEKDFGKAKKLEKSEWASVRYTDDPDAAVGGFRRGEPVVRDATLASVAQAYGIDDWYHWHGGSEDIYVGTGTDHTGRRGPLIKVYTNSNATRENARAGGDFNKMVPSYLVEAVR